MLFNEQKDGQRKHQKSGERVSDDRNGISVEQIGNCAAYCQQKIDSQHDDARLDHIQLMPFVEMIGHEIHLRFHYGARAQESQSQT